MKFLISLAMIMLTAVGAMAQYTVTGKIVDKKSGEPIIGAAVVEAGTTNGTVSDIDGNYTIKVTQDPAKISVSYLGYKTEELQIAKTGNKVDAGTTQLDTDSKALDDVIVKGSVAVARKTPVALSAIDPVIIAEKLGNQEFPEVLKSTPGVYATKNGGGYGDSKINMRGFQSANVAVVVNGVPMNDMEWGGVYWSNWTGLSDVTRSMQTQRGLGASKLSSPSVGGSINIVTKSLDTKRGGSVAYGVGNDGYQKMTATVSSGMYDNGWAFTVLLGKTWGNGYIQGTEFEGYNWFANISKRINDSHQLSLTAFSAPQWHNQRSSYDGLTIEGWQKVKNYMKGESEYKYNATYGFGKNGERKTSAKNVYNKPQISLNHQWQISDNQSLSTALYTSLGRGYGYSGQTTSAYSSAWYGSSSGVLSTKFRNEDGTFAYDKIQDLNEQSLTGSQMVMSISKNYHTWIGLVSNYNHDVNENLNISGGLDFRWYKGTHTNEIIDLYNGQYYIDRNRANVTAANNSAAADADFKNKKLHVGDVVYRDYDGFTVQGGLFAQVEYTLDQLNFFVSGSASNTNYWRYDRFYYDESHAESEKVNYWGGVIKGGANYNLDEHNNVFFNAGFISRAPFFSGGAFLNSTVSNATNPDAVNEKILSFELGYGFENPSLKANINAYYTKWMDKTMARSLNDYTLADGTVDRPRINMEGIDARHMGIEIDLVARPATWVEMTGMLSLGDWVWDCTSTGYFYNSQGQPLKTSGGEIASGEKAEDHGKMTIELDKVKVGGSAQTTAAIGIKFKPLKGLRIGGDWNLFARNYADWTLSSSSIAFNSTKTFSTPWRIPSGNTIDLSAGYNFKMGEKLNASLSGKVNNLFDQEYIVDAYDGEDHDWKTAYQIFYGFGRTYSINFKVSF